ncbi:MAG TPA: DUF169 domain-containing protein [Spirochaetota bacterium]|nr:DUF169 domain-containing protein [Spirochaetota bacterium]HOD15840.1 DUF169 domain-containing protein [Spirochaetota bacterium]HPG51384.1 DUF169 domain-containing protein [Spirochaetota bacterium]HPN11018.1 DUF169 domain-containing protein [Spirochaetota bacterium]
MSRKGMISLELPPVGIKLLNEKSINAYAGTTLFSGVSYCLAVFGATFGMELLLRPGSIKVCKWVPVVLGFKNAENEFELSIDPHLEPTVPGLYIAPLHLFRRGVSPDSVIIRTEPDHYREMINVLGWESFINFDLLKQDRTALHTFKTRPPSGLSALAIRYFNGALGLLNRFTPWHSFTALLFRSDFVTKIFDMFITRYMANMSMCRNSLVIPFRENKANISYFCTGGIAWGKNDPRNMTSGFPYDLFLKLDRHLDYPGKILPDPRLEALEGIKNRLLLGAKGKGCTLAPADGRER